jgi:hypothetical protein
MSASSSFDSTDDRNAGMPLMNDQPGVPLRTQVAKPSIGNVFGARRRAAVADCAVAGLTTDAQVRALAVSDCRALGSRRLRHETAGATEQGDCHERLPHARFTTSIRYGLPRFTTSRPRVQLTRYHGVFAASAALRAANRF